MAYLWIPWDFHTDVFYPEQFESLLGVEWVLKGKEQLKLERAILCMKV